MHTWVCGIFGVNFEVKKALHSSRLVLAFRSHGLTGCKLGAVQIRFPVWRELKLFFYRCQHALITHSGSDTLSRLKGIETYTTVRPVKPYLCVQIRFPVWRELKRDKRKRWWGPRTRVQIRFPVWRELKLWFRRNDWGHHRGLVQIRFPVWRELKQNNHQHYNGIELCSDTLSRLKGIET